MHEYTSYKPKHKLFVGIDSDGCVFDSMGIKQRECFCPWMIACFGLQPVAKAARECKEFADLYSKTRGANRHKTIVRILTELLPKHPSVIARGFKVPQFEYYCNWVNDPQSLLSDAGLEMAIARAKSDSEKKELSIALDWSKHVNQAVADIVRGIPPIPYVRECLSLIAQHADIVVVSATPIEALEREWNEHDIAKFARIIAGQELGSKSQQLALFTIKHYEVGCTLMIGDAPGDLAAAKENGCLFYPIRAGDEIQSWKHLLAKGFDAFVNGVYAGAYEASLIKLFNDNLPEFPRFNQPRSYQ